MLSIMRRITHLWICAALLFAIIQASPAQAQRTDLAIDSQPLEGAANTELRAPASRGVPGAIQKLDGFDTVPRSDEPMHEFNRLVSAFQLSIGKEKAINLARLFLNSSVDGEFGEVALDEDGSWIRIAVQDYYRACYGDIWKALDAYVIWWAQFRQRAPVISPAISRDKDGGYHIALKRLAVPIGEHPEIQNWDLEISRDGQVRVLSMQLVFPVHPGWLFYDGPLTAQTD
jgi:hypothetical protein